ncbi:hypothetical protein [Fuscovulum ytuae]|uniref:Serine acetyltransferase n=1 Tax=Fuscovulum ytuae TaxID=3042299 RepID=A0ABY8Q5I4_9RHOB|nr:hypothetical protein [Fuscovulum sp. YMD61]WGV15934.1 hypothetical protein QF092_17035 [Fuscovulum sp. YMD61]
MIEAPHLPLGRENRSPEGIGFLALLREDFQTHGRAPFSQGFWEVFWHHFGNWRMGILSRSLCIPFSLVCGIGAQLTQWLCWIDVPDTVRLGRRVQIEHFGGMILIAKSSGTDVIIRQNTTFSIPRFDRPRIGNGVDIGTGDVLIGAISIADGAVSGANAVVAADVPAGAIMAGLPARKFGQE